MIGSNKRTIQIDYLKKVLYALEHQALLPQGEYYYDLSTGAKLQQIPKIDVPRKVVAFSCGGGSFVEYEQIKALNEEKCQGVSSNAAKGSNGDDASTNANGSQVNKGKTFFDQIIYGTDHVFTPT